MGAEGYQTDNDSGLQLLGNRYYDPSTGRFISSDPIQDGDNWYAYCENDPLTGIDPDGQMPRMPSRFPKASWPKLPPNLGGKNPKWDPRGFWQGRRIKGVNNGGRYVWDKFSHGSGVDRGFGPQQGHWDGEDGGRWSEGGARMKNAWRPFGPQQPILQGPQRPIVRVPAMHIPADAVETWGPPIIFGEIVLPGGAIDMVPEVPIGGRIPIRIPIRVPIFEPIFP